MVVENIRRSLIPLQHTQPTRGIDESMIRGINNGTSTLKQQLTILINKRTAYIRRPSNPNTILHPPTWKSLVKLTTLAMTEPDIVPAIPVTHEGPFLWFFPLIRNERQLHRIGMFVVLDLQQIIRQRHLPDVMPETSIIEVRLARFPVRDERRVNRIGVIERPDIGTGTLSRLNQRPVILPLAPFKRISCRHTNGTVPRAVGAECVEAVESSILFNGGWSPWTIAIPNLDHTLPLEDRADLRPGPTDVRSLENGDVVSTLEQIVTVPVVDDVGVMGDQIALVWEW